MISWWNYNEINQVPNCNQTLCTNNVFVHENLGSIVMKNNDNTRIRIFQVCKIRSNFFAKYCEVNLFYKNIEVSIWFRDEKFEKFFCRNVTVDPRFSCCWECVSRRRNEVKEEANPTKRTSQGGTRAKCKSRNYEISCLIRFHYPLDRSTAFWKERERERDSPFIHLYHRDIYPIQELKLTIN